MIRSKITNPEPGLTKGKRYKCVKWGFWQGAYFTIINDRSETVSIYEPEKYLHTEDIDPKSSRPK